MTRLRRSLSNVLAVAYRETLVLRHDQGFLSTIVAQPIVMLMLYGFALSYTPANVPWAVLDRSATPASRRVVEEIGNTGYFLAPAAVRSYAQGRELLRQGEALAVLVVPHDFARDVEQGRPQVQLLVDGTDPITAARLLAYVHQIAAASQVGRRAPPTGADARTPRARGPIDVRQRFWFNPTLRDRDFFMAILAGMLLTNLCLSISPLNIVGERESGTFEQTLSLPVSTLEIVLGKLVPLVAVSYFLLVVAVLGSGLAYGIWPRGGWLALVVVTLPFVLASLAMGAFVSTISSSSAQAVFISVFFIMPSFVLSGVMFPYELMPPAVRAVGMAFPLRWYQIALRAIFTRGASVAEVLLPCGALLVIFAVLLAGIRWRLKPRLA
jgi:ABC-2 type transport system permease protein